MLLLVASDHIGGRVRTDELNGCRLDRGFQVSLTAYAEARAQIDYGALALHPLYPSISGALVQRAARGRGGSRRCTVAPSPQARERVLDLQLVAAYNTLKINNLQHS